MRIDDAKLGPWPELAETLRATISRPARQTALSGSTERQFERRAKFTFWTFNLKF